MANDATLELLARADTAMRLLLDEDAHCDHSVGICWCDYTHLRGAMREALGQTPDGQPGESGYHSFQIVVVDGRMHLYTKAGDLLARSDEIVPAGTVDALLQSLRTYMTWCNEVET
jgi:hypothetical protein